MAQSPRWKIYSPTEYIGCMKDIECAAMVVAGCGDGYTIRNGHSARQIVWREGAEDQPAGESYDHVVNVIMRRLKTNALRGA